MKLPSEILAFKLLRKAHISKEEKMLVLTGMNYKNKSTLYEEAKQSLKKFKGDISGGSASLGSSVKLEPTFLAENEEALLACGYVRQGQGKKVFVRHGGIFVRVSPNRLRRTHEALGSSSIHKNDEKESNDKIVNQETEESPVSEVVPAPEEGVEIEGNDREIERRPTIANRDLLMIQAETHGEGTNSDRSRRAPFQVKTNDIIKYKLDDEWITGSVLGRAGKASGPTIANRDLLMIQAETHGEGTNSD